MHKALPCSTLAPISAGSCRAGVRVSLLLLRDKTGAISGCASVWKSLPFLCCGWAGECEEKKKRKGATSAAASAHARYCVTKMYLLELTSVAKPHIHEDHHLGAMPSDVLNQENFLPCRYLPLRLVQIIWRSANLAFHPEKYYIKEMEKTVSNISISKWETATEELFPSCFFHVASG